MRSSIRQKVRREHRRKNENSVLEMGRLGFLICGFGTFFAINPSTPALMAVSTVLLMWIGGMVLFGLSAIRQRQEWLPIQIRPPTVDRDTAQAPR